MEDMIDMIMTGMTDMTMIDTTGMITTGTTNMISTMIKKIMENIMTSITKESMARTTTGRKRAEIIMESTIITRGIRVTGTKVETVTATKREIMFTTVTEKGNPR